MLVEKDAVGSAESQLAEFDQVTSDLDDVTTMWAKHDVQGQEAPLDRATSCPLVLVCHFHLFSAMRVHLPGSASPIVTLFPDKQSLGRAWSCHSAFSLFLGRCCKKWEENHFQGFYDPSKLQEKGHLGRLTCTKM